MAENSDDALIAEVGITLNKLIRQLAQAEARMTKTARKMEEDFLKANGKAADSFSKIDQAVGRTEIRLRGLRDLLLGALSVREIQQYADAWTVANNKLAASSEIAGRQARSLAAVNDIATRTRSGLTETADLYAKLLRATKDVAKSELEVAAATEIVNKAFKAGGAAASEQAAGILQLGQALSSGLFQGDELRSIRENAPLLAQAIADEFNTTIGGLKQLGAEGKLTAERVFSAILKAQPQIEAAFARTNATIGEGFTLLRNALTEYVGIADDGVAATEKIGAALAYLAENIDAVVLAGGLLGARFIGPVLIGLLARSLTAISAASVALAGLSAGARASAAGLGVLRGALALLGGPLGLAISAMLVLPALIETSSESIAAAELASSAAATALDAYATASQRAAEEQETLGGKVSATTQRMLAQTRVGLQGSLAELRKEYADLIDEMNGVGLFDLSEVSASLQSVVTAAVNAALDSGQIVLPEFDIETGGFINLGPVFQDIADALAAFERKDISIEVLADKFALVAGAGTETLDVVENLRLALANPLTVDVAAAQADIVRVAELLGGFEAQLTAISEAKTAEAQVAAYRALALQMQNTALVAQALRAEGEGGMLAAAQTAARLASEVKLIEAALAGNNEEVQRLAAEMRAAEGSAGGLAGAAGQIDFSGAAASAKALADELGRAVNNAINLGAQGVSDANKAKIEFDFRDNPIGRAGALAAAEFNSRSALPAGTDSTIRNVVEAERRAFIGARVEAAHYAEATAEWRRGQASAGGAGGGGGGGGAQPLENLFTPTEDEIERLNRQIDLIGRTAAQVAEYDARQRLLNEAKKRGLDLDAQQAETGQTLRAEIDAQAAAIGRLTQQYDQARQKAEFLDSVQNDLVNGFLDAIVEGENFAGTLANIAKQLAKAYLQALLFGSGPFAGGAGGGAGGLFAGLGKIFGFSEGGWTGPGGKNQPKGVVHGGEYVFSAAAVRAIGVPNLEAMHRNLRGYAEGGLVGGGGGGAAAAAPAPIVNAGNNIYNILDPRIVGDYLKTEAGRGTVINIMRESGLAG